MIQDKKYREYFLNPKGTWVKVTPLVEHHIPSDAVHVIEYSAYTALEEKLRVAVEALEWYDMRFSKEYKFNNGVGCDMSNPAKQAIEKIKGEGE